MALAVAAGADNTCPFIAEADLMVKADGIDASIQDAATRHIDRERIPFARELSRCSRARVATAAGSRASAPSAWSWTVATR
ncbi:hypothetical protein [Haliangium ochraceum]|uniref:hypothetical protein n=1 Tax=Haliangium ochraceum TaxID=80816 RepID=UPI001E38A5AE|nr:hypothetical protein [Haliangium ochraceum]